MEDAENALNVFFARLFLIIGFMAMIGVLFCGALHQLAVIGICFGLYEILKTPEPPKNKKNNY
jgi:hypothetical protein